MFEMEELRSATEHGLDLISDLIQKLYIEFKSGLSPAYDHFIGVIHAVDWKEPWLICLLGFHVLLLLVTILSRKHINFHMCLFLMALTGVYYGERLNRVLAANWKSFATKNYFDRRGITVSALWSGPLLVIAMIILMNTLFTLCRLIAQWMKAERKQRTRIVHKKQD